jgi:hypothetical protein
LWLFFREKRSETIIIINHNVDPALDLYEEYCLAQTGFLLTVITGLGFIGGGGEDVRRKTRWQISRSKGTISGDAAHRRIKY